MPLPPLKIAYVVMKYPTLSQTFIEREMRGVATQEGIAVEVHPCFDFRRLNGDNKNQKTPAVLTVVCVGSRIRFTLAACRGLLREIARRPALLPRGLGLLMRHWPGRHGEGWFMTIWGTLFALARAGEFRRRGIQMVHGAWATAPATAAAVLSELCGIPFSFGAHAYDLHRHGGDPLLAPKLEAARFVHTTTQANVDDITARFPSRRAEIVLARRGLASLPPLSASQPPSGDLAGAISRPVRLLSVGRLVEKKGHVCQVAACRELAWRQVAFELKIIGEGPLRATLAAQIAEAGLQEMIELTGEQTSTEVEAAYAWADIFWHTGIVDAQGDRDGLPNVIPEALAHALPVISSIAGGAGEAIIDGETGLRANPLDPPALAGAVERLANDAALRERLGANGRRWVEENFLAEVNTRRLAEAFRAAAALQSKVGLALQA